MSLQLHRLRRSAFALILAVPAASTMLDAQQIAGSFSTTNQQGGAVTLVLRPAGNGRVEGTLSGNGNTFQVEGTMGDDAAEGTVSGSGIKMFFAARVQGENLSLAMAEPDANGQPNFTRATQMAFKRDAGGAPAATSPGISKDGGNPLSGRRVAASDRYAGAWTSKDMSLSLSGGAGKYSGTLTHQGSNYPVTMKDEGPGLSGTFTAGGTPYELLVKVENGMLHINTAGTTYMLTRETRAAAIRQAVAP